jgi:hypothetical protein
VDYFFVKMSVELQKIGAIFRWKLRFHVVFCKVQFFINFGRDADFATS